MESGPGSSCDALSSREPITSRCPSPGRLPVREKPIKRNAGAVGAARLSARCSSPPVRGTAQSHRPRALWGFGHAIGREMSQPEIGEARLAAFLAVFQPTELGTQIGRQCIDLGGLLLQPLELVAHDLDTALFGHSAITIFLAEQRDFLQRHAERLGKPDDADVAKVLLGEYLIRVAAALAADFRLQQTAADIEAHRIGAETCGPSEFRDQHFSLPLTMDYTPRL